jgi:hypothetical protein
MHCCPDFWLDTLVAIVSRVFADYNIELADGRTDPITGEKLKNKTEIHRAEEPMTVLGIEVRPAGRGLRTLSNERAACYAAAGELMLGKRRVNRTLVQSWLGRIIFASCALPELRATFMAILSTLAQGWSVADSVALSDKTWESMALACAILRDNKGSALWPMRRGPGAAGRHRVWTMTDAALQPDSPADKYVGYGITVYIEHSDTVFAWSGRWSKWEQQLDITSLELMVQNMALEEASTIMRTLGLPDDHDVVQVGDNRGSRDVINGVRATAPALRVLLQQRMRRRAARPNQRVFGAWSFREGLQAADDLSKGEFEAAAQEIRSRFGPGTRVVQMPIVRAEWRNMDFAVTAAMTSGARRFRTASAA